MAHSRPVYLNLLKIRLPLTGMVSFAHRVSGVLLFISLPYAIWLLERSLASAAGFEQVATQFEAIGFRLFALVIFWSLAHHFFAGIRFLLLDFHIGVDKPASIKTAWVVIAAEIIALAIIAGAWL